MLQMIYFYDSTLSCKLQARISVVPLANCLRIQFLMLVLFCVQVHVNFPILTNWSILSGLISGLISFWIFFKSEWPPVNFCNFTERSLCNGLLLSEDVKICYTLFANVRKRIKIRKEDIC